MLRSVHREREEMVTPLAVCLLPCPLRTVLISYFCFFMAVYCVLYACPCACGQWLPVLWTLKSRIEENTGHTFNSLLCNFYRDEKDSVDWHSDDEPSLGSCPVIASLSFGATRTFEMRKKPPPVSILCPKHRLSLTS